LIVLDSIRPKTLSLINFKGTKADKVKKTLITAALTRDSIENNAKEYHHKQ